VTRREWLYSPDPGRVLAYLRRSRRCRPTRRQLHLFAAACCSRVAHLNDGEWAGKAITTAEAWADGVADESVVAAVRAEVEDAFAWTGGIITPAEEAVFALVLYPRRPGERFSIRGATAVCDAAAREAGFEVVPTERSANRRAQEALDRRRRRATDAERESQAGLLRDIIGDPFRPTVFDPVWRTEAVVGLARGMYESRDFSAMSVLADALEDAGCTNAGVLAHCRGAGPHVRGCFVLDAVLTKT
jgi:hypothetical protein